MTNHPHRSRSYRIYVKRYYYQGTLNAPANGPALDAHGDVLEFPSRAAAVAYLTADAATDPTGYAMGFEPIGGGVYALSGTYYTNHGEYARPTATIRAVP